MTSWRAALLAPVLLVLTACAMRAVPGPPPPTKEAAATVASRQETIHRIGFSIQAGAFVNTENAALLVLRLTEQGEDAFHFAGDDGKTRVRLGSFTSRELALERALALRTAHVIEDFSIVPPLLQSAGRTQAGLRGMVVGSALRFLGTPYRWGGPSMESGFDCSGLTMTAYRLNGVALPRVSAEQYATGAAVPRGELREADLVFFATDNDRRPSHVGLFVGQGRFIHAPGSGKLVRLDDLSRGYYDQRFVGGRSYLP